MAKTYTAPTTVNAGDAITASLYNTYVGTNVANLIVPPSCMVHRTSNLSGYASDTAITWQAEAWDTDSMYSSGTNVTINTTGIYLLTLTVSWACTATATVANASFTINGTGVNGAFNSVNAGNVGVATGSLVASLNATDTITGRCGWAGGSAFIVKGDTTVTDNQSRMSVVWIGKTA